MDGSRIIVRNQSDGWAECVLGDAENSPSGWVNTDFIAVDPAWYRTDGETVVYAWDDLAAPKVGVLDADTTLPILKEEDEWLVVSLRGAAGWIYHPAQSTSQDTTAETAQSNSGSTAGSEAQSAGFTVYAKDGSTATIHLVGGATYEDASGRTYIKQEGDGFYYCITTDTTYAFAPTAWTGEAYGENQFPSEDALTGADYGENQGWTGADFGENAE